MSARATAICLLNARLDAGEPTSLRICGDRIASVGTAPVRDDVVVDLHGDRVLPGLINAHDHLQLNSLPRQKHRSDYVNVRDWITDIDARQSTDWQLRAHMQRPLRDLLLIGALKNLLSGVTTVAHHDPLFEELLDPSFPVRVVRNYGWAHSLGIDSADKVQRAYRDTPSDWPWIIHAGEGIDAAAHAEFERLDALRCIGSNTILVHGVAFDAGARARLLAARAALVWCPSSNMHLFERTAHVDELMAAGRLALGSDSRLSGDADLLAELRTARELTTLPESHLESLVTQAAARVLRLNDRGTLQAGMLADLIVLPHTVPLSHAHRTTLRLVMLAGRVVYGDVDYAHAIAPLQWIEVQVDGQVKALDRSIAALAARATVHEPGLMLPTAAGRAA